MKLSFNIRNEEFAQRKELFLSGSGGFTHLHRGNPPLSGDKYIATGWYQGSIGLREVQTLVLTIKNKWKIDYLEA